MSTIESGYRITVKSWENDSDAWKTITVDGLSINEVRLACDLLQLISKSYWNEGYFGNMYDPNEDGLAKFGEAILPIISNYPELKNDYDLEDPVDFFTEFIGDYTGYSEDYFTRVCSCIKVEFIPEVIKLEDVTEQFVKEI